MKSNKIFFPFFWSTVLVEVFSVAMMMIVIMLVLAISFLHTVQAQELITLDSACGVLLQSSCPELQKYVVGKTC